MDANMWWTFFAMYFALLLLLFWIDKSINRANATLNEIRKLLEWSARKQGWLSYEEEIQKSSEWEHHLDQEIKKSKEQPR
jgi:hypothetical protein